MTSRREFLSNAFGIDLVSGTARPIQADQGCSKQGQRNISTSKTGRTTQKTFLRWGVLLVPSLPAITSDHSAGAFDRLISVVTT
jgi:hypothetical protein